MKNGEPGLKDEERGTSGSSPLAPHPSPLILNFLVGVLYPLRLIQAAHDQAGNWIVRLSPLGRWLLVRAEAPVSPPSYAQTLLVQPNLEILVFRQGLTPGLIGRITQLAAWKGLGPACTLQLQPATVYRALESGFTFESILQTLEQHSSRAVPPAVVDLLRTWAQKRDRIAVYPGAALLEFGAPEDLNEALARGLAAQRLTDRLALVAHGDDIDYKHFKLAGTRDYSLPPDRCVKLETDGVTLTIDQARSDLLLETEIPRFAEPVPPGGGTGLRQFRITPASLAAAQDNGLGAAALEIWFRQRTGESLSPAARLLLGKGEGRGTRDEEQGTREPPSLSPRSPPLAPQKAFLQQHLILKVASPEIADGLVQWPQTGMLIAERLGPTALVIAEDKVDDLRQQLALLGIQF